MCNLYSGTCQIYNYNIGFTVNITNIHTNYLTISCKFNDYQCMNSTTIISVNNQLNDLYYNRNNIYDHRTNIDNSYKYISSSLFTLGVICTIPFWLCIRHYIILMRNNK